MTRYGCAAAASIITYRIRLKKKLNSLNEDDTPLIYSFDKSAVTMSTSLNLEVTATMASEFVPTTTASATTPEDGSLQLIIADLSTEVAFRIFDIVCSNFLVGAISLLGLLSNVTTIVVLSHQVNESINIVFLGMAVSDMCVVTLALWYAITSIINEANPPNFPFEPLSFLVMTAVIPRLFFINSTCWLTALVAIIRCLCVVLPFKVGILFTPKRTAVLTSGVFFIIVFSYSTSYFRNEFVLVFFPEVNASIYIMVELSKGEVIDDMVYYLGFVALPMVCMFIVVFCTLVLVIKVKASVNWRNNAQAGKSFSMEKKSVPVTGRESATKEGKLTKMVVTITSVFIFCNMPNNLVVMARMVEPEFTERGKYQHTFIVIHDVIFLLETINSSVSFLIFYNMSSKFKTEFNKSWRFFKQLKVLK
ncbi:FMRFamide receptor [Biomphalaria pfeifferi]|uniref:FMRFamide receptor n=1 Tax=Biomphalaria pfeifferi TaxID=112525 RepID=A0AAD8C5G6_BIOPF|nr:FMRFamide receptor [Biomphalaria pfeifferi]